MFLGLPCFALGAIVGRWWAAVASAGVFIVAALVGDRCDGGSFHFTVCYSWSTRDVIEMLALTTPFVLAGVVGRMVFRRFARDRVESQ